MSPYPYIALLPPSIVVLDRLPPRIADMVQEILFHQQILTQYDTGQLILNFKGREVKTQLDKLSLNSRRPGGEC